MSGVCETSLPAIWRDTPNFNDRRNGLIPSLLLMHYTGMESAGAALDLLCNAHSNVSSHYLIDEEGVITQMVSESQRAWHAGAAYWAGESDINSCSIGIEIVNEGHVLELKEFPERQVEAVMALSTEIIQRHSILAHNVLGHSDVAPDRKKDPGEKFPWAKLYQNGIGHYVDPVGIESDRGYGPGDRGSEIATAQNLLARYGYGIEETGEYGEDTASVVAAFQRHFRPNRVDGRLDQSTLQTLVKLIETLPRNMTS